MIMEKLKRTIEPLRTYSDQGYREPGSTEHKPGLHPGWDASHPQGTYTQIIRHYWQYKDAIQLNCVSLDYRRKSETYMKK